MQKQYYHPGFEKKSNHIQKKTEFLAFRLEADRLLQLKHEALQLGIDLSSLIRKKLEKNETIPLKIC
ncbi:MAG: hypothetical protein AABX00_00370 [Nanoarchaeota archaeon]